MKANIKLFRIFGIEIGLHYSWILIAVLIVLSLVGQFSATNPRWGTTVVWGLALMTAVLFFASIVVHELSHALVARHRGLPVRSITLFALGGVAQIDKEASDAKTEFWIGIVGPITSAIIGLVCLAFAGVLGWSPNLSNQSPVAEMLGWLGVINIALAIFNMVPGFPLDGGRVLRAIIWWITGSASRAIRVATTVGQFIALALILIGLLRFFSGAGLGGLWLTFIGWFLLDAARSSFVQAEIVERLRGVHVSDVMTKEWPVVAADTSLQVFVNDYLLRSGQRCFIVEDDGRVAGIVTTHEVKDVDRQKWTALNVGQVMLPLAKLHAIRPTASLNDALEALGREDVNQLPVTSNSHLDGIISRAQILRLVKTRLELEP